MALNEHYHSNALQHGTLQHLLRPTLPFSTLKFSKQEELRQDGIPKKTYREIISRISTSSSPLAFLLSLPALPLPHVS